jgi:MFS family permease
MVAAALGFQFLSALFLQQVLGYGPARTGLAVVPVAVGIGILSLGPAGRLAVRFGSRPVLLTGLGLLAAGLAVLARLPVDARYAVDLLPALLLLGAGAGLALPTITALAMSDATEADAGLASGLANTSQQVGGALGISVLAAVAAARAEALGTGPLRTGPAALAGGFRLAFAVAAGLALAALAVAAVVLRPTPAGTGVRPAAAEPGPASAAPAGCPDTPTGVAPAACG